MVPTVDEGGHGRTPPICGYENRPRYETPELVVTPRAKPSAKSFATTNIPRESPCSARMLGGGPESWVKVTPFTERKTPRSCAVAHSEWSAANATFLMSAETVDGGGGGATVRTTEKEMP